MTEKIEREWTALEQFNREMMEHLERELVLALHHGFDGVDTTLDPDGNITIQPWSEGNEPHYLPWDSHLRRYDLRDVSYQDIRDAHGGKS